MAKEATKIRRVKATEAKVVKKPAKKATDKKSPRKINLPKPNFKKIQAPEWLRAVGRFFAKFLGPVFGPVGRYIKGSFGELKQTKWPSRKYAWILTLAVIMFSVLFAALILGIDQLFDLVVKNVLLRS